MPKRKAPPKALKAAIRAQQGGKCGCRAKCGAVLPPDGKGLVQYQHEPALKLRLVLEDGSDWVPAQHDPRYLFAEMKGCHGKETVKGRSGATVLGSDRHAIDKTKRLRGERKRSPKRQWGSRKIPPRPFQTRKN